MGKTLTKIRLLLELLIWGCISLIPLINTAVVDPIFFLLALYFILVPDRWSIIWDNRLFLILMGQYPLWNMLRLYLTPPHDLEIISSPAKYEMWVYSLVAILFATIFFAKSGVKKYAPFFLPISLIGVFFAAGYHYHALGIHKVKLWNANVFEASLFASSLSFILFGLTQKNLLKSVPYTVAIITPALVISIAYTGTRGIFIAQCATILVGLLAFIYRKDYYLALGLVSATLIGLSFGLWIDASSSGSFSSRLQIVWALLLEHRIMVLAALLGAGIATSAVYYTLKALGSRAAIVLMITTFLVLGTAFKLRDIFENKLHNTTLSPMASQESDNVVSEQSNGILKNSIDIANSQDISTAYRLAFLRQGLEALKGHVALGRGAYMEPHVVHSFTRDHKHLHNNYLSWMIWGGLLTMVSGLIWLAAPTVVHQLKSNKEQSIAALLLAVLWAVSLLFDSFLTWKNFNAFYILYACLAHQSFMPNYRADKTS